VLMFITVIKWWKVHGTEGNRRLRQERGDNWLICLLLHVPTHLLYSAKGDSTPCLNFTHLTTKYWPSKKENLLHINQWDYEVLKLTDFITATIKHELWYIRQFSYHMPLPPHFRRLQQPISFSQLAYHNITCHNTAEVKSVVIFKVKYIVFLAPSRHHNTWTANLVRIMVHTYNGT
jgi:hypothetical protein